MVSSVMSEIIDRAPSSPVFAVCVHSQTVKIEIMAFKSSVVVRYYISKKNKQKKQTFVEISLFFDDFVMY